MRYFLSTGGTSTGEPVCLCVSQNFLVKRFGDYCLHSGTFYDRVVLVHFHFKFMDLLYMCNLFPDLFLGKFKFRNIDAIYNLHIMISKDKVFIMALFYAHLKVS